MVFSSHPFSLQKKNIEFSLFEVQHHKIQYCLLTMENQRLPWQRVRALVVTREEIDEVTMKLHKTLEKLRA